MKDFHNTAIIVPARLASLRFPEKLLAETMGKPLILHTALRLKEQIPDYTKQTLADIIIKSDRGKRHLNQEIIKIIKEVKNKKNRKTNEILKEF